MALPGGSTSLEWMASTTKTMRKLQGQMAKLFPKELMALIKKTPEVESITWEQYSEAGFSMTPYEVNTTTGTKKFKEKDFRKEVDRLLLPMPSRVLLDLYGHYTQIVCAADKISSEYEGSGDYFNSGESGIQRDTPGKVEFTDSPLGKCFDEYYELRNKASESAEKLLKTFVAEHEVIESIQWEQYTPGFMDGETCEFYVRSVGILCKGEKSSEHLSEYSDNISREQNKYIKEAQKVLESIHDDILYLMYGDHMQITVTAKKVTKSEYMDHD